MKLPSDLAGITHIPYQSGANLAAAVGPVATDIQDRITNLGSRGVSDAVVLAEASPPVTMPASVTRTEETRVLGKARDQICLNAISQGWRVKTNSDTTLRLVDRRGRKFTFSYDEDSTPEDVRVFAGKLRAGGLRVHQSVHKKSTRAPW